MGRSATTLARTRRRVLLRQGRESILHGGTKGSTILGASEEEWEGRSMAEELKHLGSGSTEYRYTMDPACLETFANPHPDRDYAVTFTTREVTCLCPITGQPDFYRVTISYRPDRRCLESKSLKLYFFSFRQSGMFAEDMANRILEDLVRVCRPRWMRVEAIMNPRGGIGLTVQVEYHGQHKGVE
jgi:7-cyano-7-deazaguanine reductase